MMFIELTDLRDKEKFTINLNHIETFFAFGDGTKIEVVGGLWEVLESYEEVKALIKLKKF